MNWTDMFPTWPSASMFHPYALTAPIRPAEADDRCAMRRNHRPHIGETMVYVEGVGFCCELCAISL